MRRRTPSSSPTRSCCSTADFKRSGVDLILSKDDHELVLHDYFKGEKRAALASPDGAHLTGDIVNALTGHVEYAQADGSASAGQVIGHVTKLAGTATAIRNGVSIILNQGDNVEKGDVVQSGSDSTLGITFIDGTVFGLSSNARMVLNEMVYDPNGSNNSSLISLVAGTISFVAGETAKHGDMKIDTPVATMGIRGTAVLVEIDFTVPGQDGTPDAKFQVLVEPDGTTGSYILFDKTTLPPIAIVNQAGQQINISNGVVSTTNGPLSPDVQKLITDVFTLKFASTDTKSTTHFTDSINPNLISGQPIKTANGITATPIFLITNPGGNSQQSSGSNGQNSAFHISGAPTAVLLDLNGHPKSSFALNDIGLAKVGGLVNFVDINAGDTPTVTVNFSSFSYQNAQHQDLSGNLTPLQLAEIAAAAADIVVVPSPNNKNTGSATWTYTVPGAALDFLAPGQTLTLSFVARVDNNFALNDEFTQLPFTVTIIGVASEIWIASTSPGVGGLWSDPTKWKSGHAPTATDDAIVMTDPSHGLTPSFPVTINAPAVAGTLTMNDLGASAPVLINQSTLTIGSSLTVAADSVVQNFGAISVGGGAEFLNQAVLLNFGTLSLAQGGDFQDQSSITNSGEATIDVTGGTLNVLVDVVNSGEIIVETGATLALSSGTIDGGTVTVNGTLDLSGNGVVKNGTLTNTGFINAFGAGNALDAETVTNTGNIDVFGALLLDQGTAIANTGGIIAVVDSAGTLTLDGLSDGATIDGGTVTINGTLNLSGNGVLKNGTLTNTDQINASGVGNALDAETVTSIGNIDVSGALLLDQGTTITNDEGSITVESTGTLTLDGVDGATIDGGAVTVGGTLDLSGNGVLKNGTLSNTDQINAGGTGNALDAETITNTGNINVSGALTIDQFSTVNNINGSITVDSAGALTLINATISAGTVTDNGTLNLQGAAVLKNGTLGNSDQINVSDRTASAADLKFLHHLQQAPSGTSNR